jgi:hypothetical protein
MHLEVGTPPHELIDGLDRLSFSAGVMDPREV